MGERGPEEPGEDLIGYIERELRALYVAMLASFVIFGVSVAILGATLPKLIREFHWSYTASGLVLAAGSVAYFVSTFLSGILVKRLGPKRVIVAGLALQALGLSLFGTWPAVTANLLLNVLMGAGQGCTEVTVNSSVVRMERGGQSRLMNLMHAGFCVGAIVGPFAVGTLVAAGARWQLVYRAMALVALLVAGTLWLLPFARLSAVAASSEREPEAVELARRPLLILAFLMLLVYVGSELGVSAWVGEYYVKTFGTSASTGAFMVSVFWTGLLLGRAGLSFAYRGSRHAELLLVLASACTVALLFAVLMRGPWLAGVGFFAAGLGFSAIYPVVIALVGEHFPRGQSVAIGFVATGGGIGAFAFPPILAAVADRVGIQRGFFLFVALNALMMGLACAIIWRTRRIQTREADGRNG